MLLLAWPAMFVSCVVAFLLELAARRLAARRASQGHAAGAGPAGALLHACMAVNVAAALALPSYLIHATVAEPLAGFALIMISVVIFLKLWSYVHANSDLRARWQARAAARAQQQAHRQPSPSPSPSRRQPSPGPHAASSENSENFAISESEVDDDAASGSAEGDVSSSDERVGYPENLAVGNYAYFLFAPTLCYQISYPRNPSVRVSWLMRRVVEMFIYLSIMTFLIEQYIIPSVNNSVESLENVNRLVLSSGGTLQKTATALLVLLERVLKLSIPTLYVWLCGFYCLFHLWLNILAELTRFGDRQFYKSWWNASTIDEYWRLWNMPVHKWLVRHVYFPSLRVGLGKAGATFVVFLLSAVFHELVVGLPLHVFRSWAFLGIMLQLPLIAVTTFVKNKLKSDQVRAPPPPERAPPPPPGRAPLLRGAPSDDGRAARAIAGWQLRLLGELLHLRAARGHTVVLLRLRGAEQGAVGARAAGGARGAPRQRHGGDCERHDRVRGERDARRVRAAARYRRYRAVRLVVNTPATAGRTPSRAHESVSMAGGNPAPAASFVTLVKILRTQAVWSFFTATDVCTIVV